MLKIVQVTEIFIIGFPTSPLLYLPQEQIENKFQAGTIMMLLTQYLLIGTSVEVSAIFGPNKEAGD
jgi:hypothetical protein